MLTKFCSSIALLLLIGCTIQKPSAPVQAAAIVVEVRPKLHKPTVRQLMPSVQMKVASPKLIHPTKKVKLQYKPLLARPTKSAI